MTSVDREKFAALLKEGSLADLGIYLDGKSESELRSLASTAMEICKQASKFVLVDNKVKSALGDQCSVVALHAALATTSPEQVAKVRFTGAAHKLDFEFLKRCNRTTLQVWADSLAGQNWTLGTISDLASHGLCERPESDDFVIAMMGDQYAFGRDIQLVDKLRADQRFLDYYLWRFFELEGKSDSSLAGTDKYRHTWEAALVQLVEEGVLPRERLLDASLSALNRGFIPFRAGWYSRFHEALKPTLDERIARMTVYARLVGSDVPPTVAFALEALTVIDKAQPLPVDLLEQNLGAALMAKSKSTVVSALSLIERALSRHPDCALSLCQLITQALVNSAPDVQTKVFKLLDKFGDRNDSSLRSAVVQYEQSLAPSVQKCLIPWVTEVSDLPSKKKSSNNGAQGVQLSPASDVVHYAMQASLAAINPLEACERLEPINSVYDLIQCCSYVLEHPEEPIQMERAIDGIIRLTKELQHEFADATAPLKKRVAALAKKSSEDRIFWLNLAFVDSWLSRQVALPTWAGVKNAGQTFLHDRLKCLLIHINQRNELPMFSAPTHSRGWINPAECVFRWNEWRKHNQMPEQHEMAIALLRLPLKHLDPLLPEWTENSGEFWDAVRFAAGHTANGHDQNHSPLWTAAHAVQIRGFGFEPFPIKANYFDPSGPSFLTWISLLAPAINNTFVESGLKLVSMGLSYDDKSLEGARVYFDVLTNPSFVFDQASYRVLATGLVHQNVQCVGTARDAAISHIEADRLDVAVLGEECAKILFGPKSKATRLANSMTEIARVGPKHTNATRQILENTLTGGETVPRDISAVLEVLNELLHSEGSRLEAPKTIEFLSSLTVGGKTGKLVKQLTGK